MIPPNQNVGGQQQPPLKPLNFAKKPGQQQPGPLLGPSSRFYDEAKMGNFQQQKAPEQVIQQQPSILAQVQPSQQQAPSTSPPKKEKEDSAAKSKSKPKQQPQEEFKGNKKQQEKKVQEKLKKGISKEKGEDPKKSMMQMKQEKKQKMQPEEQKLSPIKTFINALKQATPGAQAKKQELNIFSFETSSEKVTIEFDGRTLADLRERIKHLLTQSLNQKQFEIPFMFYAELNANKMNMIEDETRIELYRYPQCNIYIPVKNSDQYYAEKVLEITSGQVKVRINDNIQELIVNAQLQQFEKENKSLSDWLEKAVQGYGGPLHAFDNERKTRYLIDTILFSITREGNPCYQCRVELEQRINMFDKVHIADIVIISKDTNKAFYIIEVKKSESKANNPGGIAPIEQGLKQNLEQMRQYCLQNRKQQVYGILTNFKEWYFNRYSVMKEIEDGMKLKGDVLAQQKVNPFEISQKFVIIDENGQINKKVLYNVVHFLQYLPVYLD